MEVVLALVFLFALAKLTGFDKWLALKISMNQISAYEPDLSGLDAALPSILDKTDTADGDPSAQPAFDWSGIDTLAQENEDFFAWLTLPGTDIDYPVMLGADNDYYLHRDFYGKSLAAGTVFADYRCAADFSDSLTILYGHNMRNGTMFHQVLNYRDQAFLEENPAGWLVTPDMIYQLELFACCRVESDSSLYTIGTLEGAQWSSYLSLISQSALAQRNIDLTEGDHLVALSTCSYEFENARTILFARLTPYLSRADSDANA